MDKAYAAEGNEDEEFLKEYASHNHQPSDEELAEMKAAFGQGAKVINILTGQEIQL